MSVLIRGMEMPESCWECEVGSASQLDNKTCPFYAMEGQEQENYQNKIAEGCPVSYVPPHGRLIDADALMKEIQETCKRLYGTDDINAVSPTLAAFKLYIGEAPTIIEAEE